MMLQLTIQEQINSWFEHGTMWCDYIDENVAQTIVRKCLQETKLLKVYESN